MLLVFTTAAISYSGGGGSTGEGQSCDAINICASGTCPEGMTQVAPPERSEHYSIRTSSVPFTQSSDLVSYTPDETVSIFIRVEKQRIQKRFNKGTFACYCDAPYRTTQKKDCRTFCPSPCDPARNQIRVNCSEPQMESAKYIGLLLYAVDATEQKVGSWELPTTPPATFWTPPDSPGCSGFAVMHADAQSKNYLHKLVFRAPAAGSGSITFRALLKQGDTNGGAFYWPVAPASGTSKMDVPLDRQQGGDLMLTEGPAGTGQTWFKATGPGQSCDDVCQANGKVCDLTALEAKTDDPTSLEADTRSYFTSNTPAVGSCNQALPAVADTAEKWMFFHSKQTTGQNTCAAVAEPSCSAQPADDEFKLRRLCPCTTSRRRLRDVATPCPRSLSDAATSPGCPHFQGNPRRKLLQAPATTPANSATRIASSTTTSLLLIAAALGGVSGGSRGGSVAFVAISLSLLVLAVPTEGHNWMWNPTSRSSQASTAKPCRARRSNIPDIHVNPGQEFKLEWATGHGESSNSGAHYFTLVKQADKDKMVLIDTAILDDYLDTAPTSSHMTPKAYWDKRHWSWDSAVRGSQGSNTPGGGSPESDHTNEGKIKMNETTDPINYIHRPQGFNCARMARDKHSPVAGACFTVPLSQWKYPDSGVVNDIRAKYTNPKYPWIVSAHRFASEGHFPNQADIARFKIDGPIGEYIMHWYWRGYSDCNDIAVLPNDPAAGTVVPETSEAMYGVLGTQQHYSRIDHCQFGGGRMQAINFLGIGDRDDALQRTCSASSDYAWANGATPRQGGGGTKRYRTCYVIPPAGATNFLGETQSEAIAACQNRCDFFGSGCVGVNVVPQIAPTAVFFQNESRNTGSQAFDAFGGERAVPYGHGNCNETCFARETNPAQNFICYPIKLGITRVVEEDWTLAVDDPNDEIWYSTCYKKDVKREFQGLTTPCMDFFSEEFPNGMCPAVTGQRKWRHGDRCISCAAMEEYGGNSTTLPVWELLPAGECKMCDYVAMPDLPPPTSAPTLPASAYDDGSVWPHNFTSLTDNNGGQLFIGWKVGGLEANDVASKDAITFTLRCPKCAEFSGYAAIGINPTSPDRATMTGTSVVIWDISASTIREYEITSKSMAGVRPWGQMNHLDNIAMDATNGYASFSIGVGSNPERTWNIGSSLIAHNLSQRLTWAYSTSAGFGHHTAKGTEVLPLSSPSNAAPVPGGSTTQAPVGSTTQAPVGSGLTPSDAPTNAPTASAPAGGADDNAKSAAQKSEKEKRGAILGLTIAVPIIVALLLALVAIGIVVLLFVYRAKYLRGSGSSGGDKFPAMGSETTNPVNGIAIGLLQKEDVGGVTELTAVTAAAPQSSLMPPRSDLPPALPSRPALRPESVSVGFGASTPEVDFSQEQPIQARRVVPQDRVVISAASLDSVGVLHL